MLYGGPRCLPASRSYLTILLTPAEPQVTLDVAGRRTGFLQTPEPLALFRLDQPDHSPALTVM